MVFSKKIFIKLSSFTALFFITTKSAIAGGPMVVFGPVDPSAVPSLSSTMLIVLSLLLFVVALRVSKNRESGSNKFFVALIGSALLMTSGGVKFISDINANVTTGFINAPAGEVKPIFGDSYNQYENSTGVPLQVKSILLPASCETFNAVEVVPPTDQKCSVGLILEANGSPGIDSNATSGGSCEIDCSPISVITDAPQ